MNTCKQCQQEFPTWVIIDGTKRNLHKRKYCLECSPFGLHNTKQLNGEDKPHLCACGETDPNKFYGHKRTVCAECHKQYTLELFRNKKKQSIEYMGGKCSECGYDKYDGALEFHHVDPSEKDSKFRNIRHWKWERIQMELDKCILLCSNCHREIHADSESVNYP